MMKILKLTLAAVFISCFIANASYAAEGGKIGYVDLSRLFDEYHKTQEYDKLLESKHNELEKLGKEKIDKIHESESKLSLLQDAEKKTLQDKIDSMKSDAQDFVQQQQANLTKERNEKIREILLEIEKVVSDYAEAQNYSIILNDRVLIYGDPAKNVTEDILAILNK